MVEREALEAAASGDPKKLERGLLRWWEELDRREDETEEGKGLGGSFGDLKDAGDKSPRGEGSGRIPLPRDVHGRSPAHVAAAHGHLAALRTLAQLLGKRAREGESGPVAGGALLGVVDDRDRMGRTALHYACAHGHAHLARWILGARASCGLIGVSQDSSGDTAMHAAAACEGGSECVRALLAAGVPATVVNRAGCLPAHVVCSVASAALLAGAKGGGVEVYDHGGRDSILCALSRGHIEIARALSRKPGMEWHDQALVPIDPSGFGPVEIAASIGDEHAVEALLRASIPAAPNPPTSATELAYVNNHHNILRLLQAHGWTGPWLRLVDEATGMPFWLHERTHESHWANPEVEEDLGPSAVVPPGARFDGGGEGGGGGEESEGAVRRTRDYDQMVREYKHGLPWRATFTLCKDPPKLPRCSICEKARVSWVILPCDHACLCDACKAENNIVSLADARTIDPKHKPPTKRDRAALRPAATKTSTSTATPTPAATSSSSTSSSSSSSSSTPLKPLPSTPSAPWTACPVCLCTIHEIRSIDRVVEEIRRGKYEPAEPAIRAIRAPPLHPSFKHHLKKALKKKEPTATG